MIPRICLVCPILFCLTFMAPELHSRDDSHLIDFLLTAAVKTILSNWKDTKKATFKAWLNWIIFLRGADNVALRVQPDGGDGPSGPHHHHPLEGGGSRRLGISNLLARSAVGDRWRGTNEQQRGAGHGGGAAESKLTVLSHTGSQPWQPA